MTGPTHARAGNAPGVGYLWYNCPMENGGRRNESGATPKPVELDQTTAPQYVPSPRQADRAWTLTDPMRLVRAQRHAAATQINRSIKAWRKEQAKTQASPAGAPIPQGNGSSLPDPTRAKMEQHLGADLSGVKIHTGGEAAEAASSLGARAFAVGQDVHFGDGEFNPGSKEGDRLLAHELAHTVQAQRAGVQRKPDDKGAHRDGAAPEVSDPDEPAEKEADAVADGVADQLHAGHQDEHGAAAHAPEGDKAATRHEAPIIGAKLSGVGLKIFRADPRDKDRGKRKLRVASTGTAPKLGNLADLYDRDVGDAIDAAQKTLNDLYRDGAEYGDGSCAYCAMLEVPMGRDPTGANHFKKSQEYSKGLERLAAAPRLPASAKEKLIAEKAKLDEAVAWTTENRGKKPGQRSTVPRWAKPYKRELEG